MELHCDVPLKDGRPVVINWMVSIFFCWHGPYRSCTHRGSTPAWGLESSSDLWVQGHNVYSYACIVALLRCALLRCAKVVLKAVLTYCTCISMSVFCSCTALWHAITVKVTKCVQKAFCCNDHNTTLVSIPFSLSIFLFVLHNQTERFTIYRAHQCLHTGYLTIYTLLGQAWASPTNGLRQLLCLYYYYYGTYVLPQCMCIEVYDVNFPYMLGLQAKHVFETAEV